MINTIHMSILLSKALQAAIIVFNVFPRGGILTSGDLSESQNDIMLHMMKHLKQVNMMCIKLHGLIT